jgi:5-methylcytosine-specific restriction protein A
MKPCAWAGCLVLVAGERYCARHAKAGHASVRQRNRAARIADRESRTFLASAAWQRLRLERLTLEPFCRACRGRGISRLASDVDHIAPRNQRPDLILDLANTQSLCHSCHSAKTGREKGIAQ